MNQMFGANLMKAYPLLGGPLILRSIAFTYACVKTGTTTNAQDIVRSTSKQAALVNKASLLLKTVDFIQYPTVDSSDFTMSHLRMIHCGGISDK